ncbi:hypothetical protein BO94DRAFT_563554 [Aspergillus sclerotioniger CBS 115572]|uniref:Uncharacterized protein n=1 Tax=Aspergillus sclerotioniger CBS 115572 TaxID=1450535 RepID=A0A317X5Z3_9EURO|nr:hypothetical protein BO94DRAFT_563554 [Aspergillus sclerotioniger CBS 115572]PWY94036.1 hypothetical protein BO94DRAFT_563554 [Aspergillus sclerotioniger CBS 115572]
MGTGRNRRAPIPPLRCPPPFSPEVSSAHSRFQVSPPRSLLSRRSYPGGEQSIRFVASEGAPTQSSVPQRLSNMSSETGQMRRCGHSEAHPVCMRCQRSQNHCKYGPRFQWQDGLRAAGKCRGRTGIGSRKSSLQCKQSEEDSLSRSTRAEQKDRPDNDGESALILTPPSSHSPLRAATSNYVSNPTENSYRGRYYYWKESKAQSPGTSLQVLPWSIGVPDVDNVCLSFYESVMCNVAVTVDDEYTNPLRNTVMRMIFRSELTYYSVLMASAQYLRSFESRFDLLEMQVRQKVLGGLRRALTKSCLALEDVLLPTIFLCSSAVCVFMVKISHSCDATWVRHLTCFQLVIKQKIRGHTPTYVPQFFLSYFSAHLVLAKSLFPIDKALADVDVWGDPSSPVYAKGAPWTSSQVLSKVMRPETLHEINMWNGMSNQMLLLINDILSLKNDVQALQEQDTLLEGKRTAIEAKIITLHSSLRTTTHLLPESLRQFHDSAEGLHRCRLLEYTSEAYRLAACLLLSEASTPAFLGYTSSLELGFDSMRKQRHIDSTLSLIESIVYSLDYLPISWPLWALFIASCCCTSELEKTRALALFHAAQGKAPYENTIRAQTVVSLLWQRRELHEERERKRNGRFEWESVMEFLGWQTSFA